ncbi:MAG: metal ABC transporter substrate-binding protein [bacterium]
MAFSAVFPSFAQIPNVRATDVPTSTQVESRRILVLTSIPALECFARNVAGELEGRRVFVEQFLSSGQDPHHSFDLSPADRLKLGHADLLIINGLKLETWLPELADESLKARIVNTSQGLPLDSYGQDSANVPNPHVWLSPLLASRQVEAIAEALIKTDPQFAPQYRRNADAYKEKLRRLHEEIKSKLESIPAGGRKFVSYHEAFYYFSRDYGLEQIGSFEARPGIEPSLSSVADLIRTMKKENITTVFVEPQLTPKLLREIAKDYDLKLAPINPMETGKADRDYYEKALRNDADVFRTNLTH